MQVLLTHEQADFDAVAALYAASLLHPGALAVLPRRMNRNVRAFLTLYGDQFPFLEADDLPREPIDSVCLVDTQTLPSLRGLKAGAAIRVIDHHPPDADGDSSWDRSIEGLGACTTLLVEMLQETGISFDRVGATLLLLGIYEDTGSLSYAGTTSRDLRAASWLLERGASLRIADDFLNHPLSAEQRRLYEDLLASAQTSDLQGLAIVVACAEAEGLVDEISTLAHKLRDLFDPAGLFVIVALNGSIQIVARSTTDLLNVGQVMAHFGGGGHNRAAAAILRGKSIEEVCQELWSVLPAAVQPVQQVAEIMSRDPQILDPGVTVGEAFERMQRFGHEGYPVVEKGQVVGLLTRRAVDRAMSHDMSRRPVGEVMEAGGLTVSPTDSIQHLRQQMIRQNWGQVPVADPASGEIIGIVTRTDVLRTLDGPGAGAGEHRLTEELEKSLVGPRLKLLRIVAAHAARRQAALYVVGGFVRDLLLGLQPIDFDLVVEGDAIGLAQDLAAELGGKTSSHNRFGTAKWSIDTDDRRLRAAVGRPAAGQEEVPAALDLVAARTEFYTHPTALPSVQRGSIKLDLHRRDFTINTLALRLDGVYYGQLLDPWGGGQDLENRTIRVLHSISFVDDPTRILRAVRLEQRLGFAIEPRTMQLLQQARGLLSRVSGERLRSELEIIFAEPKFSDILARLASLRVLAEIDEGLAWDAWLETRFRRAQQGEFPSTWALNAPLSTEGLLYALWLYRLDATAVRRVIDRLHFPAAIASVAQASSRLGRVVGSWSGQERPSEAVDALEGVPEAALAVVWLAAEGPLEAQTVDRYLTTWKNIRPATDGGRLRQHGLPPGPAYRRLLGRLRAAILDGEVSGQEAEERFLQQLIAEEAHPDL
jgi:tRNA nucleotidyltransferase (CCA-adding enzyme)